MAGPGGAVVGRVSIQVLPDTSSFREKLKSQLSGATKGLKVDIPVEVQSAQALAELAAINKAVSSIDDVSINVNTGQIASASQKVSNLSRAMASATNKAKAMNTATRSMSRTMFVLTTAALGAAPAIGAVATALAGLPSLVAAAAASFAALKLGWEGMKKAASTLSDEVKSLKSVLSAEVQSSFASVFQDLAGVFPTLESGLSEVVNGLAKMAQGFANVVSSAEGVQKIGTYLSNLGDFLGSLQPMVESFTSAFLTLAAEGSKAFDMLASTLNTFAKNFNSMIQQVTSNGTFRAALTGLNQVLSSVLGLFNQLFRVGLKVMAQIGGPLSKAIQAFGDFLAALIPILGTVTATVATILTPVLQALTPIVMALQPLFKQIAAVLINNLVPAINAVAPILLQIANYLASNAQWIAPLIVSLYAAAKAYKAMRFAMDKVATGYKIMAKAARQMKNYVKNKVIPAISSAIDEFNKLKGKTKDLGNALVDLSKRGFGKAKNAWKRLASTLRGKRGIFGMIVGLVVWLATVVIKNWDAIVNAITTAWNWIVDVSKTVWNSITSFLSGIWNSIVNGVTTAFNSVIDFFVNLPGNILEALGNLGKLLLDVGKNLLTGLWNGIQSAAQWLWKQLRKFFSWILPDFVERMLGIASPSKVFRDIGHWIPIGFAKGINDRTGDVINAASKMSDIATLGGAHVGMVGSLSVDDYDTLPDVIAGALSNWEITIDREGLAEMVNYSNRLNDRRG